MSERIDKLMQAAGLKENVLNSLERGDSMFVLTDQTLLFQDSGGTRRVTLRDLKRIHSDQDGLLRVETPAGTALTANLVGFDPSAVQAFFAQVRDATGRAKQQSPVQQSPVQQSPVQQATTTSSSPAAPAPAPTPTPASPSAAPPRSPEPPAGATWTASPKPAVTLGSTPMPTPPAPERPAPSAAPSLTPPPSARTGVTPQMPPAAPPSSGSGLGLSTSAPTPFTPAPLTPAPPAFRPQEAQATVKPVVKAVRTPTVITDPEVLSRAEPAPVPAPVATKPVEDAPPVRPAEAAVTTPPRAGGSAAGSLATLAAVAGGVSAWIGALKVMSLVMLLATFGMAYFLYDRGQGLNGFWTLIAGGMGAVGLWVLSDLVKLLVSMAQAVSAEGGVMDVD